MNQPLFSFVDTDSIAQIDVWTNLLVDCASQLGAIAADPNLSTAEKVRLTALVNADLAVYTTQQQAYVTAIADLIGTGSGFITGSISGGEVAVGAGADEISGSSDLTFQGSTPGVGGLTISNVNNGATSLAGVVVQNNSNHTASLLIHSSGFTATPDTAVLATTAANGLNVNNLTKINGSIGSPGYVLTNVAGALAMAPAGGGSGTITDWTKVQPIPWGSGSQEVGSISALFWRRVGDSMEIRIIVDSNGTGVNASGNIGITIPDGQSIDLTKLINGPADPIGLGETGWFYVTGQGGPGAIFPAPNGTNGVSFWWGAFSGAGVGVAALTATQFPFANGAGGVWLSCKFSIPIVAWA